jgi:uncharacterized protein (DUF433 family)
MAAPAAAPDERKTEYPHVVRTPGIVGGRPRIAGTRLPVWQIALSHLKGGTVADLVEADPDLSSAAVHAALAYYYDHQAAGDADIDAHRPERVLADLRAHPDLVEERPGVFRGTATAAPSPAPQQATA